MTTPPTDSVNIPTGLLAALREARHVAVPTGAGISAESSVPTFREAQTGLWAKYNPDYMDYVLRGPAGQILPALLV